MNDLMDLRKRLFDAIGKVLKHGHKRYEGAMHLNMPNYFEDGEAYAEWQLDIDMYVFGPSRRMRLTDNTYEGLMSQLETWVTSWEHEAERRNKND